VSDESLTRWYRSVLGVLPRSFLERRQDDLARLFGTLLAEARRRGGGRAAFWCFARESVDVLVTAIRLRVKGNGKGEMRMGGMTLDLLAHDVRLAVRGLSRNPGFTAVVVITLALGIGATTAIFSVVNSVLIRPLPFRDAGTLVVVWENDRETGSVREAGSWPDYLDLRRTAHSFADVAAFSAFSANLTREGADPERVRIATVTGNMGALLGVAPVLGRDIGEDEARPGGELVAVISDGMWTRAFGRDPDVLGETMVVDEQTFTVVGVHPAGLDYPEDGTDAWVPLQTDAERTPRHTHPFTMVARLAPGATVDAAQRRPRPSWPSSRPNIPRTKPVARSWSRCPPSSAAMWPPP